MSADKEETQRMLLEYESYKNQIAMLQENIALLENSIIQITAAISALETASSMDEGNEILLPVGSESFLQAKITDKKNAIVGIGAGVVVKRSVSDAIKELDERKKDLEKVREERDKALEKAVQAAQAIAPKLQDIIEKTQKEG
jgi:prefoldin alpha subunit